MNTPVDHSRAQCVGCRRMSIPRETGTVPAGWSKNEKGYWCGECKKAPDA